jgi:MFS family permease
LKIFPTLDSSIDRNLLILFAAGLLFWSSLTSLLPTLPLYIDHIGASKQQIGIILSSFAVGMLVFRPTLGKLADERGRKIALLIGMLVAAIAPLGYLVANSIPLLIILRIFHGVSIAAYATAANVLVVDLAPIDRRGEIIGYMSLVAPIGMGIGPALGGYVQELLGYTPLFLLSSGLGFFGLLGILQINTPSIPAQTVEDGIKVSFWGILFSSRARVPAIVLLFTGLAVGTLHTFAPLYIKSTKVDLNPGLFYTIGAISSFSIRMFAGKASDRLGRGLFVTIGLAFYALSMLLLTFVNSTSTFILAALAEGVGGGTLIPMMSAIIADRSLPRERGRMFATCISGFDFGIAIAGSIFGAVAERFGYPSMFACNAVLIFLALLVFLTQSSKNLPKSLLFALGRGRDFYALN